MKKTLVHSMREAARRWSVALFNLGWEQAHPETQIFTAPSVNECDSVLPVWRLQIKVCQQTILQQNLCITRAACTR